MGHWTLSRKPRSFQCKYHGLYTVNYGSFLEPEFHKSFPNPPTRPAICTGKKSRKAIGEEVCLSHVMLCCDWIIAVWGGAYWSVYYVFNVLLSCSSDRSAGNGSDRDHALYGTTGRWMSSACWKRNREKGEIHNLFLSSCLWFIAGRVIFKLELLNRIIILWFTVV